MSVHNLTWSKLGLCCGVLLAVWLAFRLTQPAQAQGNTCLEISQDDSQLPTQEPQVQTRIINPKTGAVFSGASPARNVKQSDEYDFPSPDGKYVVHRELLGTRCDCVPYYNLVLEATDGSGTPITLVENAYGVESSVDWSPDSTRVFYEWVNNDPTGIFTDETRFVGLISADGRIRHTQTMPRQQISATGWTANSAYMVVEIIDNEQRRIVVFDTGLRVVNETPFETMLAYSTEDIPRVQFLNGTDLAYLALDGSRTRLTIFAPGSADRQTLFVPGHLDNPFWHIAPDGQSIAILSEFDFNAQSAPWNGRLDIFMRSGKVFSQVSLHAAEKDGWYDLSPEWTSDNKVLLFLEYAQHPFALKSIDLTTGAIRTVSIDLAERPTYSPDRKYAILDWTNGLYAPDELGLLDIASQQPPVVIATDVVAPPPEVEDERIWDVSWSPDNKTALIDWAVRGGNFGKYNVQWRRLDGSSQRMLVSGADFWPEFNWSSDGRWLAYDNDHNLTDQINLFDTQSQSIKVLKTGLPASIDQGGYTAVNTIVWSPDNTWLATAYDPGLPGKSAEVWVMDRAGKILSQVEAPSDVELNLTWMSCPAPTTF